MEREDAGPFMDIIPEASPSKRRESDVLEISLIRFKFSRLVEKERSNSVSS
ncbi:hypothetical protein SDC9_93854 [bioreactor metagenome]|uniref:Uncharacterized protein n=1 Tax=bioreactor metagenome TaxID=1076179 RepID=A0A645A2K3_9ZZZZ